MTKIAVESKMQLCALCEASEAICRQALLKERGHVRNALRRLIAEGKIGVRDLNPLKATVEDYALCVIHSTVEAQSKASPEIRKIVGATETRLNAMRKQFAGEKPIEKSFIEIAELHRKSRAEAALRPTIDIRPFPKLSLSNCWEGHDTFKSWIGFEPRGTAPISPNRKGVPTKTPKVLVTTPGNGGNSPSKEQAAAYRHLKTNEAAIARSILRRIFAEYPKWRQEFEIEEDDVMPVIRKVGDLRNLIGLQTVHVLAHAKHGQAYIGFELACTWDDEHGLGVMTHEGGIVTLGAADRSFLDRFARMDGGKPIEV